MSDEVYDYLFDLRGAHNLWYIYTKNSAHIDKIRKALTHYQRTNQIKYDFEEVLDECGFEYFEDSLSSKKDNENNLFSLWNIEFE